MCSTNNIQDARIERDGYPHTPLSNYKIAFKAFSAEMQKLFLNTPDKFACKQNDLIEKRACALRYAAVNCLRPMKRNPKSIVLEEFFSSTTREARWGRALINL